MSSASNGMPMHLPTTRNRKMAAKDKATRQSIGRKANAARKTRAGGRPKLAGGAGRSLVASACFRAEDAARVLSACERAGKPVSEWLRDAALSVLANEEKTR